MQVHANDKIAPFIEVLDLDTGEEIKHCIWANQETGEYKVYLVNKCLIGCREFPTEIYKGNIALVYKGEDE